MKTVHFLCGNFNKDYYVYAIRNDQSEEWHYFEESDSFLEVQTYLLSDLIDVISQLKTVKPIAVTLNSEQLLNYVNGGQFVFKGKELMTFIQLSGTTAIRRGQLDQSSPNKKVKPKSTHDILFEAGKTNPAIFLREFEKCSDVKIDKDKLYKLRNFLNEDDKPLFSALYFKNDWATARATFLKKYSLAFTENKKKELCFRFEEESSLRSFVARKMNALSTYTTLPFENQLEIILSELPTEIANVFIVEDKLYQTKADILDFCDLIQEYWENTESSNVEGTNLPTSPDVPRSDADQELEIFDFQEGIESDTSSNSTSSSGSSKRRKMNRSGRPVKIPRTIAEESGSSTDSETQTLSIETFKY